jgi:hypothetical protein
VAEPDNLTSKQYALSNHQIFDGVEKKILSSGEGTYIPLFSLFTITV